VIGRNRSAIARLRAAFDADRQQLQAQVVQEAGRADRTQEKLDAEFAARKRAETDCAALKNDLTTLQVQQLNHRCVGQPVNAEQLESQRLEIVGLQAELRFLRAHQCQTPRDDLIRHRIAIQVLQQILMLLGPEPKAPTKPATDEPWDDRW
jgi:hypothetical protein